MVVAIKSEIFCVHVLENGAKSKAHYIKACPGLEDARHAAFTPRKIPMQEIVG